MTGKKIEKEKALSRLESLCSKSEQCESDINRKMIQWGLPEKDRKEIISSLKENRYLDNARFARSFTMDKARFSAWGPYKIRAELIKRNIKGEQISEALEKVGPEIWKAGILKCALSKSRELCDLDNNSYEYRVKMSRYLAGRGYGSELTGKVINYLKKRQESDDRLAGRST